VDGSTTARPSHSVGLNTPMSTVATVVRHQNSSATRAQFHSHCVSVIHVSRLTELLWRTLRRRSLKYVYAHWLSRVNSHLILTCRHLAHAGMGAPARALQS